MRGTQVHGVDVYEGDGDIDWRKVSAAGNQFAITKISEGMPSQGWAAVDPRATADRIKAIRNAGMIAGGYAFLRPKSGRTGAAEARLLVEHGKSIGLWQRDHQRVRDIRPVLDCEASGFDLTTASGRRATRVYVRDAVREVKRLTGHAPIIYTGKWWWDQTQEEQLRWTWHSFGCPLWLAAYVTDPAPYIPRGWRRPAIWQFTDKARVDGIDQPCDRNVFTGGDRSHFINQLTF
jgi:lysozyme